MMQSMNTTVSGKKLNVHMYSRVLYMYVHFLVSMKLFLTMSWSCGDSSILRQFIGRIWVSSGSDYRQYKEWSLVTQIQTLKTWHLLRQILHKSCEYFLAKKKTTSNCIASKIAKLCSIQINLLSILIIPFLNKRLKPWCSSINF